MTDHLILSVDHEYSIFSFSKQRFSLRMVLYCANDLDVPTSDHTAATVHQNGDYVQSLLVLKITVVIRFCLI